MISPTHSVSIWLLAPVVSLVLAGCRENGAAEASGEPAGGAITLWTDSTELFMEHPALIVGAPDRFAVHLTDLTDFTPLRSGRITLHFQPRDGGTPLIVTQDTPRSPGIYGPAPEFTGSRSPRSETAGASGVTRGGGISSRSVGTRSVTTSSPGGPTGKGTNRSAAMWRRKAARSATARRRRGGGRNGSCTMGMRRT